MENLFHPLIVKWFREFVGTPTDIQKKAWPEIASGRHVLITAPTGSGKTLTSFLWAINKLVTGKWERGTTRVLYVSPLKALNNDIRRNLIRPLEGLKSLFLSENSRFPSISVMTRSGDTSESDRRQMVRNPPEIMITTPESLNIILSSKSGIRMLSGIKSVILDEIHSVVGDKRGVHLITAIERIVRLAGEFQRISLSATVRPLEKVTEFVGGYEIMGDAHEPLYTPRRVSIIRSDDKKEYRVRISFPAEAVNRGQDAPVWSFLADKCREVIAKNRSTLVFTNSRRIAEKLTYMINDGADSNIAYAHHGSLSREIRTEVEQKLKDGNLSAIVATSSLEMGIDIGDLDEVILIQSPPTISSAIQRIGRAGHRVGDASRCTIFPTHDHDFLDGAVLAKAVISHDIEAVEPVKCPLDVLSQVIISMTGIETWTIDDLFMWVRSSYPYRHLSRTQFDLVLEMLAGKYSDMRLRDLNPRISIDRIDNTVTAKKGALLAIYMSGGTIPDRGYYKLRHHETGALIGELDEEYVWEARVGQLVTFGTGNWRINRITHNDVFVTPSGAQIMDTPFWRSNELNRDFYFSEKISSFLEMADERLDDSDFGRFLKEHHFMDETSSALLTDFLKRQKEYTNAALPHRHHIIFEQVQTGPAGVPGNQLVIHTMWGGRLNRPYAMAINAAWMEKHGEYLEIYPGNDSIVFQLNTGIDPDELINLVTASNMDTYLKMQLEKSGCFGARFRECAGRALLITRNKISERMPLWMTRLRSKKLLEKVIGYEDFPILIETWRTCLNDEFDLDNLRLVLGEIASGVIKWSHVKTLRPSPFAANINWNQVNQYMYENDQPASNRSLIKGDLLQDILFNEEQRPAVNEEVVKEFELKRKRLATGYSPQEPPELLDWVKERLFIPVSEWEELISAIERNTNGRSEDVIEPVSKKLIHMSLPLTGKGLIAPLESYKHISKTLTPLTGNLQARLLNGEEINVDHKHDHKVNDNRSADEILINMILEWFRFYGPVTKEWISHTLGISINDLEPVLDSLIESNDVITGRLIKGSPEVYFCDTENYEIMLRINRARSVPVIEPLDAAFLPLFLAGYQGLSVKAEDEEALFTRLEQLLCLPLPAGIWETDILPARMHAYKCAYLDRIVSESDLVWKGFEKEKTAFCFESELDLLGKPKAKRDREKDRGLFPDTKARYGFFDLMEITGANSAELTDRLWKGVWSGIISNDGYSAVRRGIENNFSAPEITASQENSRRGRGTSRRSGFNRWKGTHTYTGNWFRLPDIEQDTDLVGEQEIKKERVRLLLDRYGVIFREILFREVPEFSWKALFRSLYIMELSGEIMSGLFFKGVTGPQFISRKAFQMLSTLAEDKSIYSVNAFDPASVCGMQIDALKGATPRRLPGNSICYRGTEPVVIVENNGKVLTIMIPPDDPDIELSLAPIKNLLEREFSPLKNIAVETVNGEPATKSPYVDVFKRLFEVQVDYKNLILYKRRK
ncbi:MAG: DEAD/DEAH box helicase [Desulfatiglans sp.]|nr:DEAD/DEAH box helicase [Desulfatiglans sp.]